MDLVVFPDCVKKYMYMLVQEVVVHTDILFKKGIAPMHSTYSNYKTKLVSV